MSSGQAPRAPLSPASPLATANRAEPGSGGTVSSAPSLSSLGVAPSPPAASSSALPHVCPACGSRYPGDFRVCPRDATPLVDAPEDDDPLVGSSLGESYEVVGLLGEGGMGRVYEARHTRLPNKRYAIKMLHAEMARQPEVVARFQREAEAVAGLEHPNIVGVHDVSRAPDGRPYIVQELLDGEELGKYLDRVGKLPAASAVRIVRQICNALGAAHAKGIVHRDVKPENVVLLGDLSAPTVKVLDFGISKVTEANTALTKTGVVMGTPAYMAPEQARGDRVDSRADVYAVGAILYRALTGRKPFEGLDPMATLTAVLVEEPPRPRAVVANIPEALELVVQRAMAKDPSERTASVEELDAVLAPFDRDPRATLAGARAGSITDGDARTILATDAVTLLGAQAAAEAGKSAKRARPALVVATLFGAGAGLTLLADGLLAVIRWVSDVSRAPGTGEIVLAVVVAAALAAAPLVLWVRFVVRNVWSNTPRAIELAQRAKGTLLAGAAGYTLTTLGVRVIEIVVRRTPEGVAHPAWTLVVLAGSLVVAVSAWFLSKLIR